MTSETHNAEYVWRPRPALLAKVKQYFLGFLHNQREIHARRETIAKKLKIGERTLDRYLNYLREDGWMETAKRTPRTAIRTVKIQLFSSTTGGSPTGLTGGSLADQNGLTGGSLADQNGLTGGSLADHIIKKTWKENLEGKLKQHHPDDDAAPLPEFSREQIEDPRVQAALRRARWRIERADNPKAYEAAVIRGAIAASMSGRQEVRCDYESESAAARSPNRPALVDADETEGLEEFIAERLAAQADLPPKFSSDHGNTLPASVDSHVEKQIAEPKNSRFNQRGAAA